MSLLASHIEQTYQNKKILILGFGREGQSTYRLLRQIFPEMQLYITDEKLPSLESFNDPFLHSDQTYLSQLKNYDVIFKSPGVSKRTPELITFALEGGKITTQLSEFLAVYRHQTIGVTGTKGKSTTSAMIAHILREAGGHDVVLAGNIGTPLFEVADHIQSKTLVVAELSSYQLDAVKQSPHAAVLLNIFAEHLNYHGTHDEYRAAKFNITIFQTADDFVFYHHDLEGKLETKAKKHSFTSGVPKALQTNEGLAKELNYLSQTILNENLPAALAVSKEFGIDESKALESLRTFKALPHRLELVGTFRGIRFFDDTLATIPEAAVAALQSIPQVSVMLLGGYDRGLDYTLVIDAAVRHQVKTLLFFPPSGEKMLEILTTKYNPTERPQYFIVKTMEEAVRLAYSSALNDSAVLLSPASPSFGQFKDYEDKSQQYRHWIHHFATQSVE